MHTLQLGRIFLKSVWTTGCLPSHPTPIQSDIPCRTQCIRLNARPWRFQKGPAHKSGHPWRFPGHTPPDLAEEKAGGRARGTLSVDQGPSLFMKGETIWCISAEFLLSGATADASRREETLTGSSPERPVSPEGPYGGCHHPSGHSFISLVLVPTYF